MQPQSLVKIYKPTSQLSQLQQKQKQKQPWNMKQFISYAYYIAMDCRNKKYKNLQQNIKTLNNHQVFSIHLPCLIYEHICETFCSLYEAYEDKDQWLMQKQLQQIEQCIQSYTPQKQYRNYQCYNELEIDENITDVNMKIELVDKIYKIIDQSQKLVASTSGGGKLTKSPLNNKKKTQIMTLRANLKKRHDQKIKPQLSKLILRAKSDNHQQTGKGQQHHPSQEGSKHEKQIDQRQFVINFGIKKALAITNN